MYFKKYNKAEDYSAERAFAAGYKFDDGGDLRIPEGLCEFATRHYLDSKWRKEDAKSAYTDYREVLRKWAKEISTRFAPYEVSYCVPSSCYYHLQLRDMVSNNRVSRGSVMELCQHLYNRISPMIGAEVDYIEKALRDFLYSRVSFRIVNLDEFFGAYHNMLSGTENCHLQSLDILEKVSFSAKYANDLVIEFQENSLAGVRKVLKEAIANLRTDDAMLSSFVHQEAFRKEYLANMA